MSAVKQSVLNPDTLTNNQNKSSLMGNQTKLPSPKKYCYNKQSLNLFVFIAT